MNEPRLASIEEITAVHDSDYIQQLQETIETQAPTVVADFDDPDGFTYVTSTSFDDARKVADCVHCINLEMNAGMETILLLVWQNDLADPLNLLPV